MATDPSLSPNASLSPAVSPALSPAPADSTEVAMILPEMVVVLPSPSGRVETQVAYAEPVNLAAVASFAGSQPSAPAAPGGPFPPAPQPALVQTGEQQVAALQPSAPKAAGAVFLEPLPASLSPRTRPFQLPVVEGGSDEVNRLIEKYAALYDVPVQFVRRVVRRESTFNPNAFYNGHWGLMQIKHATARGMGYDGPAKGLLDAETNLKYAVRYLRGAWMVAGGNPDLADRLYQSGYYYHARRQGLLDETGLGRDRVRRRGVKPEEPAEPPVPMMGLL